LVFKDGKVSDQMGRRETGTASWVERNYVCQGSRKHKATIIPGLRDEKTKGQKDCVNCIRINHL
jgi:hypothetical protein